MSIIGLDIGNSHIKGVEMEKDKNGKYKLLRYAVIPSRDIITKIFSTEKADNNDAVAELKSYIEEAGFKGKNVACGLPENKIYTKIITMPRLPEKEMKQAVEWEATQYLPNQLSDVYLQYTILNGRNDGADEETQQITPTSGFNELTEKIKSAIPSVSKSSDQNKNVENADILLVAAPKDVVHKYMKLLTSAGLYVTDVEPASIATIRGITFNDSDVPSIVMNYGHNSLELYLVVHNRVRFVRSTQFGVSQLVTAISENLDMPPIQANEYLYTYGFNESDLDGKITEIIKPIFDTALQEIKRFQSYTEKRISFNKEYEVSKIKRLVVTGGGALIPNLMLYLISNVSLEVEFADPWDVVDINYIKDVETLKNLGPLFVTAVGTALKI